MQGDGGHDRDGTDRDMAKTRVNLRGTLHIIGRRRCEAYSESLQSRSIRRFRILVNLAGNVTTEKLLPEVKPHGPSMASERGQNIRGRKARGKKTMSFCKDVPVSERQVYFRDGRRPAALSVRP